MERYTVREWNPIGRTLVVMNLAGLAITVVGLLAYGSIWAAATGATSATFNIWDVLLVAVVFVLMILHEGIHGIAIAAFGGKPEYGAIMIGKVVPAFYSTSPGTRFTRTQFIVIALAPAVILGVGAAIAIALLPSRGWLVVPAAVHLGGCVGDFAMTFITARLPAGSLVEDMKSGMRLYIPDDVASSAAH